MFLYVTKALKSKCTLITNMQTKTCHVSVDHVSLSVLLLHVVDHIKADHLNLKPLLQNDRIPTIAIRNDLLHS